MSDVAPYDDEGFNAALEAYHGPRKRERQSSRYLGVSWHAKARKWRALHHVHARQIHIGYFDSERDAALAADAWRVANLPNPPQCPALTQERLKAASAARRAAR